MKKLLLLLLVVFLVGCENENPETPNDVIRIDPNSELVRSLNLLYDPNFYSIEKLYVISLSISEANSIEDAAQALRESLINSPTAVSHADLHVNINGETHTASFEELFEWMGFKDENNDK